MRIVGFSTGRVRPKRGTRGLGRYLPGGWSDETLPVCVFVVEHPGGLFVFDTGQSAAVTQPGFLPRWHPYLRLARFELSPEDEAAPQLRRLGFDPDAARWIVLSHMHTDHVGGLGGFPQAEIVVSRAEWIAARGLRGRLRGYVPRQWPAGVVPRLVDFDGPEIGPFASSLDLAGDGRLVLVPTPGHAPGHVSALVRTDSETYLLAGDLAHTAAELDVVVPAVADYCRANGVVVLTAHDQEALDRLTDSAGARS